MIPSSSSALSTRVGLSATGILLLQGIFHQRRDDDKTIVAPQAAAHSLAASLLEYRAAVQVLLHALWQGLLLQASCECHHRPLSASP